MTYISLGLKESQRVKEFGIIQKIGNYNISICIKENLCKVWFLF